MGMTWWVPRQEESLFDKQALNGHSDIPSSNRNQSMQDGMPAQAHSDVSQNDFSADNDYSVGNNFSADSVHTNISKASNNQEVKPSSSDVRSTKSVSEQSRQALESLKSSVNTEKSVTPDTTNLPESSHSNKVTTENDQPLPKRPGKPEVDSVEHHSRGLLVVPKGRRWMADTLTVVCRHESGQPSESFLLRGNPSKTVANILMALNVFVHGQTGLELLKSANFAQLATTALSDQSKPTPEVFEEHRPKALFIMGEQTANLLMGEQRSLAEWQLKPWKTAEGIPIVVTYHPYEIFKSPQLKKQVMKDLIQLSQWLIDDE